MSLEEKQQQSTEQNSTELILTIENIMEILPHKYPMLLIDKAIIRLHEQQAIGIKCVSMNEWFFQGHFPAKPVMPGVLIIEAMAQTSIALCYKMIESTTISHDQKSAVYLSTVDSAKFRKPVVPGDLLELKVTKESDKRGFWKFQGEGIVNNKVVCSAEWGAFVG